MRPSARPASTVERSTTRDQDQEQAAATGTASRRCRRSGSGPVSSLPGISTMIAKTKSTMMAPA